MSTRTLIIEVGIETTHEGRDVTDHISINWNRLSGYIGDPQRRMTEHLIECGARELAECDREEARRG